MACGKCGGKGCCGSSENTSNISKPASGTLFITFKVFPMNTNVAIQRI